VEAWGRGFVVAGWGRGFCGGGLGAFATASPPALSPLPPPPPRVTLKPHRGGSEGTRGQDPGYRVTCRPSSSSASLTPARQAVSLTPQGSHLSLIKERVLKGKPRGGAGPPMSPH
jgi:hypothetical protein